MLFLPPMVVVGGLKMIGWPRWVQVVAVKVEIPRRPELRSDLRDYGRVSIRSDEGAFNMRC